MYNWFMHIISDIYFKDNMIGLGKPAPCVNINPLTASSSHNQRLYIICLSLQILFLIYINSFSFDSSNTKSGFPFLYLILVCSGIPNYLPHHFCTVCFVLTCFFNVFSLTQLYWHRTLFKDFGDFLISSDVSPSSTNSLPSLPNINKDSLISMVLVFSFIETII